MYLGAVCKTSDKSIENSTRMKKIKLVVIVLVRIKRDIYTHCVKLEMDI